jgi:AcrR family transcriptional regulator
VSRRAQIIAVATKLFRERGFHAVGIDEIGTASGISGPGIYRHFASKDDLLVSVFEDATDDLWTDLDPDEHPSVEAYVRSHVAYVLAHADAIDLWYQEGRHLPKEAQRNQRRLQRRYVERWVEALRERRPDLDVEEARIVVQSVIGLIHSAAHSDWAIDPEGLRPMLERMAIAALLA